MARSSESTIGQRNQPNPAPWSLGPGPTYVCADRPRNRQRNSKARIPFTPRRTLLLARNLNRKAEASIKPCAGDGVNVGTTSSGEIAVVHAAYLQFNASRRHR